MDFPEIRMLWVRGPLGTLERLSIVSHLKNNPLCLHARLKRHYLDD